MNIRRVILALVLLTFFSLLNSKTVHASDAPYCDDTRHLCSCTIQSTRQEIDGCCLNTMLGEMTGVNLCVTATELLVKPTGRIKSAMCPAGTGQPWTCAQTNPDFCCKPNAVNLAGDCVGLNMSKSCTEIIAEARSKNRYYSRNVCGSLDWRFVPGQNVCLKIAATPWAAVNTCTNGSIGVDTAIGCVPTANLKDLLAWILNYVFFASGGIILLMVISTGYTLITSQGNPEKLQAAKENIVSLLSGLILIAFSFILLQAIGADILNLPTFK